jgi:hypothetical protein
VGPREVPELKIRERPPSTLRNIEGEPPGGAGAEDPGASTINAMKHLRRVSGRPDLKIRERPPSMVRNIDDGPPGGARAEDLGAPTINAKNVDGGPS